MSFHEMTQAVCLIVVEGVQMRHSHMLQPVSMYGLFFGKALITVNFCLGLQRRILRQRLRRIVVGTVYIFIFLERVSFGLPYMFVHLTLVSTLYSQFSTRCPTAAIASE